MSSVTGIRIDSLLHSLKELQTEKQCLEQKLNERKCQAKTLERRVDNCNTKLTQMREMHQKLAEMQKVAVQKVQQTQEQVDSLHELNQAQSNKINDLNNHIQQEKDRGLQNIENFQERMSALSKKLTTARQFYKTEALQRRIQETCDKTQHNQYAVQTDSQEVNTLTSTMENLQMTRSTQPAKDQGISHQTRLLLWAMLEEEERCVRASLQRLREEQQEICALLQESTPSQSTAAKHYL